MLDLVDILSVCTASRSGLAPLTARQRPLICQRQRSPPQAQCVCHTVCHIVLPDDSPLLSDERIHRQSRPQSTSNPTHPLPSTDSLHTIAIDIRVDMNIACLPFAFTGGTRKRTANVLP